MFKLKIFKCRSTKHLLCTDKQKISKALTNMFPMNRQTEKVEAKIPSKVFPQTDRPKGFSNNCSIDNAFLMDKCNTDSLQSVSRGQTDRESSNIKSF